MVPDEAISSIRLVGDDGGRSDGSVLRFHVGNDNVSTVVLAVASAGRAERERRYSQRRLKRLWNHCARPATDRCACLLVALHGVVDQRDAVSVHNGRRLNFGFGSISGIGFDARHWLS